MNFYEIKKERVKKYLGIGLLAFGVLAGAVIVADIAKEEDTPAISYEQLDIVLPDSCRYETIDNRLAIVKIEKVYAEPYEVIDENGEVKYIAPPGYYLESEYYSYIIVKKKKDNKVYEEKIYNTVIIEQDENGNVNYSAPEGYTLGVNYKAAKIATEIFYIDDYMNNNVVNEKKLILALNENRG